MLIKISRKACLKKFPGIPHTSFHRNKIFYPEVYKSYLFSVDARSIRGYVNKFSEEVEQLFQALQFDPLIFLGDSGLPWYNQKHDYSPVKKAQAYLKANKVTKEFNGALMVSKKDLAEFSKHLFWLIRCCASLPDFYFIDRDQNIAGTICKYGNLHLDTLNKTIDKKLNTVIKSSAFIQIPALSCHNKFGKTSAIRNRKIIV